MRFKGDKVGADIVGANGEPTRLAVGAILGPRNDGAYLEVTDVWFDDIDHHTYVDSAIVQMAPEGENTRYYGGADPSTPVPETRERISDEVTPR